jgi:hypothetical protein
MRVIANFLAGTSPAKHLEYAPTAVADLSTIHNTEPGLSSFCLPDPIVSIWSRDIASIQGMSLRASDAA